jgi:hypothetical protein
MKCPKCNYTSFDYLDSCKKCDKDLLEHREKYNIRSVLFATTTAGVGMAAAAEAGDDFEFDFNEDEQAATAASDEAVLPVTEALPEQNDDPFGLDEEPSDFNFDSDDTFSFDDDEL